MLSKYLDIRMNLKKLDERAAESQKVLKKVQDEVQKTMEAQAETVNRNVSYIR
jgi:proteasome assembly chaperone (PAC2) family protein